ncbi:hypothetical protein, partial [Actinobacillus pleuropneumoniae]|uniref:hypothetical protein n=1 Tax=Actinobacillus pleuropneumoniae TaxID=715 RepID=UPI00227B0B18
HFSLINFVVKDSTLVDQLIFSLFLLYFSYVQTQDFEEVRSKGDLKVEFFLRQQLKQDNSIHFLKSNELGTIPI